MLKSELLKLVGELQLKRGDGIIVVSEDGSVFPLQFVALEEGPGDDSAEIRWIFSGDKVSDETKNSDCPSHQASRIKQIFPVRTGKEAAVLLAKALNLLAEANQKIGLFFETPSEISKTSQPPQGP